MRAWPCLKATFQVLCVACGLLLLAGRADAQSCASPTGAPVTLSTNPQYFVYGGKTTALVGLSHEYICHVPQPASRQAIYCTLETYPSVLSDFQTKKLNVIRLWAVFNHSPGKMFQGTPFNNEQPFLYSGGRWNLDVIDTTYLNNLDAVVCDAYLKGIVVELTLLDPWSGNWSTSPFNPVNTVGSKGFTARQYFMRFESADGKSDTSGSANYNARLAQNNAVAAVVNKLKRYPNIIWEVANEPDLIPGEVPGITPANTFDLQKAMIDVILQNDTSHLVMVEGHTNGTFAWNEPRAKVEGAHYTNITSASRYGAIEMMRAYPVSPRPNVAVAFNEGRPLPDPLDATRDADDVRAEAWEFAISEGGLFDGYSLDRSAQSTQDSAAQLAVLAKFLRPPAYYGGIPHEIRALSLMQQATCNGATDWCQGIPVWGNADSASPFPCNQNTIYWSTMRWDNEHALYLHHSNIRPATNGSYDAVSCSSYRADNFQYRVTQTGCWAEVWKEPKTGVTLSGSVRDLVANTWYLPAVRPSYTQDMVVLVSLWRSGTCY